jgi:transposase
MTSEKYILHILDYIHPVFREHPEYWLIQDNAPCHKSVRTKTELRLRQIRSVEWSPYSPHLNIIEHVWNYMKNWIQKHYWKARYSVRKDCKIRIKDQDQDQDS